MDTAAIRVSVMSLAKSNNGFFKSEKQASFLTKVLNKLDGFIGFNVMYVNSVRVFVEWDEKGITKVYSNSTKTGDKLMFVRTVEGQLSVLQQKELKRLHQLLRQSKKAYAERVQMWEDGSYGTGDYKNDELSVRLYQKFNNEILDRIDSVTEKIASYNQI